MHWFGNPISKSHYERCKDVYGGETKTENVDVTVFEVGGHVN